MASMQLFPFIGHPIHPSLLSWKYCDTGSYLQPRKMARVKETAESDKETVKKTLSKESEITKLCNVKWSCETHSDDLS